MALGQAASFKREKSNAQKWLESVEKLDAIVTNKLIEQQQWKEIALGITANMGGERVQSSGSQSKMADALDKCMDMEAEIDRAIDNLIDKKREVIATIEKLESPSEYRLLHDRYIKYIDLKDIAENWGKEYNTITTMHGRAITNLQKILDEK